MSARPDLHPMTVSRDPPGNRLDDSDDPDRVRRFLALALAEARRYGDDDDIWVRELVQNARDAGATTIRFSIERNADGSGVYVVDDDGSGMSRATLAGQLLRLFSSSKSGGDAPGQAAGCFGVGFWSVLRATPRAVVVDTHDGRAPSGVVVDVAGATVVERDGAARNGRQRRGTTVRLFVDLVDERRLRAAIRLHAATVGGLAHRPPPRLVLAGTAGDEVLNTRLTLDDDASVVVATPIRGAGFVGVVGLSPRPRVELFHHGLRVVEATTLQALVPTLAVPNTHGFGVVARVDVEGLRVLIDRRTVADDDVVRAVVAAVIEAARRLERRLLDDAAPLSPLRRLLAVVRDKRRAIGVALAGAATGLVVGSAIVAVVAPEIPARVKTIVVERAMPRPPPPPRTIGDAVDNLGPPRIDPHDAGARSVELSTTGVVRDSLRLQVLSMPDDVHGLVARPLRLTATPSTSMPMMSPTTPHARFAARGVTILPSSPVLTPVTARVDGRDVEIARTDDGLPAIALPIDEERIVELTWMIADGPTTGARASAPPIRRVASLVPLSALAAGRSYVDGIRAIAAAVQHRVHYTADAVDARRFADDPRSLVDKALDLGIGDCDVINTVLVRALQQAGYEARLAVGVIVDDDRLAAELHAWAEVADDDGGWLSVDASPPEAVPDPSLGRAGRPTSWTGARRLPPPTALRAPTTTTTTTTAGTTATTTNATAGATTPTEASPSTTVQEIVVGAPARHEDEDGHDVVALVAGVVGVIAVLAAWRASGPRRRRRSRADDVDDDAVTSLLAAALRSGAADSLGIWQRRVLPTSKGTIDLRRARDLHRRGLLVVGAVPPWLSSSTHGLDAQKARVAALLPFLPKLPRVVELAAIAAEPSTRFAGLQQRLDGELRGVVLRVDPRRDDERIVEHHVRAADGSRHQIVLGARCARLDDDVLWRRLLTEATTLRALRRTA